MLFEMNARHRIVNAYTKDCKTYEIEHNEDITTLSAQVASWCLYLS